MVCDHQGSVDVRLVSGGSTTTLFHCGAVLCFLYRFKLSGTEGSWFFAPCAMFWSAVGIGLLGKREGTFNMIRFPMFNQTALKLSLLRDAVVGFLI